MHWKDIIVGSMACSLNNRLLLNLFKLLRKNHVTRPRNWTSEEERDDV